MAPLARGQPGYFDSSAWGEGPWEGEVYSIEGERLPSLMSWTWLCLPAWNRRGRRRNQDRELEKEGGEGAGKKKPGERPILKVTPLVPALPHHTPKPRHWAIGCGDKVCVVCDRKPLGIQGSRGEAR